MAVKDHGIEVLKKAGEEVTPGDKSDYYIKTSDSTTGSKLDDLIDVVAKEAKQDIQITIETAIAASVASIDASTTSIDAKVSTEAKQDVQISELQDINSELDAIKVDTGSIDTKIDVNLSTRASEAKQDDIITELQSIGLEQGDQGTTLDNIETNTGNTATNTASIDAKVSTEAKQDTQISELQAVNTELDSQTAILTDIENNTDLTAINTGSIDSKFDVNLSTRSSEATLLTRATEATQLLVKGVLDSIFAKISDFLTVRIQGQDGIHTADVTLDGGKKKLEVKSSVTVGVGLGRDPLPDTYFTVNGAGAIGDTIRLQIVATTNDPTSPDRDLPAVDYTYTLVAEDVGDEAKLAENFKDGVNADTNFQDALLRAEVVNTNRAIVHISSTIFSLQGEFAERDQPNDVQLTTTGTTATTLAFDTLIAREKETTLARDPNNPHRAGILGISGTVISTVDEVDNILEEFAADGGGLTDLSVNGSITPVEFTIDANPADGEDKVIDVIKLYATDANIKVSEANFLGLNSALTNGLLVEVTKDGITSEFRNLLNTPDILARFASGAEKNKIINQAGRDYIEASYSLVEQNLQFIIRNGTTDQIKVTVRDNLSQIDSLFVKADGFLKES